MLALSTAIILVFVYLFGLSLRHLEKLPTLYKRLVLGLTFGTFGLVNVMTTTTIVPGLVIDGRNAFVIVASVFGGWVSGAVATVMILAYRVFVIGGMGAWPAALNLVPIIWIGVYWYKRDSVPTALQWLYLGCWCWRQFGHCFQLMLPVSLASLSCRLA